MGSGSATRERLQLALGLLRMHRTANEAAAQNAAARIVIFIKDTGLTRRDTGFAIAKINCHHVTLDMQPCLCRRAR